MAESAAGFGTSAAPGRHAVLRVGRDGFAEALGRLAKAPPPLVADWAARRRPLMARRRGACDREGRVAAGLPLPPAQGKGRLALSLEPAAIESVEPPPTLEACASVAPPGWRATIEAALDLGARAWTTPRCFGSLAWSALTGLAYLGETSDLDLIFVVGADADLSGLLAGLGRIAERAPMRLDGEIILAQRGLAANWRELAGAAPEVLVKSMTAAALMPRAAFLRAGAAS